LDDLVSIILPVYNSELYINQSIQSVLNQSHENFELIIINDGSTDRSEEIIRSNTDNRIHLYNQENCGVSTARNMGLQRITGDFFCFLDSDDLMPPNSIEARLNVFQSNEEIEFVDGVVEIFNEDFSIKKEEWTPNYIGNPFHDLLSLTGNSFFGPSWMIKRNPKRKYRFDERLTHGEDLLFFIELAYHGGLYTSANEIILQYRSGHASAMKNLEGLHQGYRQIYQIMVETGNVSGKWLNIYKSEAKKIIIKSLLREMKPVQALNELFSKWI